MPSKQGTESSILSNEELANILSLVRQEVLNHYKDKKKVKQMILFGSYAKDLAKTSSDIDILILFETKLPTISDFLFMTYINEMHISNKQLHLCFEVYKFYEVGAENYYKDVRNYGKVIYDCNKEINIDCRLLEDNLWKIH